MSIEIYNETEGPHAVKILSGKTTGTIAATGGGSTFVTVTVNHNIGYFPMVKAFLSFDGSPAIFGCPAASFDPTYGSLWNAVTPCTLFFTFDATTITFYVEAWDGLAHTYIVNYLIYAERTGS